MGTKKIMWLLAASGAVLLTLTVDYAKATDANGNKFRHLPIQWCALAGSPTAVSPGTVDPDNLGADMTTVLWRRHERVSDRIYLTYPASDAANNVVPVTFRSAADQQTFPFLPNRTFPVITGPHANGDLDIVTDNIQAVVQACNQAWGPSAPGLVVVNVNHLFNNGTQIGGEGYSSWGGGGSFTDTANFGFSSNFVFIEDRSNVGSSNGDANLLGHELGHALNMFHTSPSDNLMSVVFINDADPPHTFSTNIQDGVDKAGQTLSPLTGTLPRTINQVDWYQRMAQKWPGTVLDPPDTLINALLPTFLLLDGLGDVAAAESGVNLSAVRVSGDVPGGVLHINFRLVGPVIQSFTPVDYFFLADLDNNSGTGGTPAQFPSDSDLPPNSFTGVELIVRVRALLTGDVCEVGCSTTFTLTPTVWLFQGGTFVKQAANFASAFETRSVGEDVSSGVFGNLEVFFPSSIPTGNVRVQAITHDGSNNTIDKLDNTDAGGLGSLAPPVFPVCGVNPGQVQPGVETNVTAHGLVPSAMAKVILGDVMLLVTNTDAMGNLNANVLVPSNSGVGHRLVTVGSAGTALEADCSLDVEGTPAVPVAVPVDINPTSCPNPLNVGKQGTIPVAILGTASLNVRQLDPASIRLAGIAPSKYVYQDVASPYSPYIGKTGANACTTLGADGYLDLSMSFDAPKIAAALGSVTNGQVVTVSLSGNFLPQYGGGPVIGEDVVVIKTK
jgi:hypothetical protein